MSWISSALDRGRNLANYFPVTSGVELLSMSRSKPIMAMASSHQKTVLEESWWAPPSRICEYQEPTGSTNVGTISRRTGRENVPSGLQRWDSSDLYDPHWEKFEGVAILPLVGQRAHEFGVLTRRHLESWRSQTRSAGLVVCLRSLVRYACVRCWYHDDSKGERGQSANSETASSYAIGGAMTCARTRALLNFSQCRFVSRQRSESGEASETATTNERWGRSKRNWTQAYSASISST